MNGRHDDVGQSLGLPDFVDPADVGAATFEASTTWGEEASAPAPESSPAQPSSRRGSSGGHPFGDGARRTRQGSSFSSSSSTSRRSGERKQKKQLTWAEKAARKEKRAQARREAEAAERERDPLGFAREIVLTQLAMMPRSRAHLAGKLREKEVDEGVIDAVLDRMEDVGLVDDVAYAEMLVRTQVASRGLARRALRQELSRKGIDEETASLALEQVDDDDEREQALAIARKKMSTMSRLDEQTQTRRLAGLLARKGYASSMVWSVIRQVQAEASGQGEE